MTAVSSSTRTCSKELYDEITDLSDDVQKALDQANASREALRVATNEKDRLEKTIEETQRRNRQERAASSSALATSIQREKQSEQNEAKLRQEMREENNSLRKQILESIDIDDIRLEIQASEQKRSDDEKATLLKDIEKLQSELFSIRREREFYKVEKEQSSKKDVASIMVKAIENIQAVNGRNYSNENACDPICSSSDERIQSLTAQVAELTASVKALESENDELKKSAKNYIHEKKRQSNELKQSMVLHATAEADKRRALHQNESLEQDLHEASKVVADAKAALEESICDRTRLEHALSVKEREFDSALEQSKMEGTSSYQLLLAEREALRKRIESLTEKMCEPSTEENFATDLLSETRDQLVLVQHQCAHLEHRIFVSEGERNNIEAENQRLIQAFSTCKLDYEYIQKEKEAILKKFSASVKKIENKESEILDLRTQLDETKEDIKTRKSQLANMEEKYDIVVEEKEELVSAMRRLGEDLISSIAQTKEKEKELKRETRRGEMYRQKALEAHGKTAKAKEALSTLSLNVSGDRCK